MKKLGIVLIVLGIVMTLFTGFNLVTKKKVVDLGKVEINKDESHPMYWSPVLGLVLLGTGVVIAIANKSKTSSM